MNDLLERNMSDSNTNKKKRKTFSLNGDIDKKFHKIFLKFS